MFFLNTFEKTETDRYGSYRRRYIIIVQSYKYGNIFRKRRPKRDDITPQSVVR